MYFVKSQRRRGGLIVLIAVAVATILGPGAVTIQAGSQPDSSRGLSEHAARTFWQALEGENYAALPQVKQLLSAAFLTDSSDARAALLLAHAHLWRAAEHGRDERPNPRLVENLMLSQRWFETAARLDPTDARIGGWLGSAKLPLGRLMDDGELVAAAELELQRAVESYPAFNHFTAGYALSTAPPDSRDFQTALTHMRMSISHCSGVAPEEDKPTADLYQSAMIADSACANSDKAPFNYQGFFLNLGDMLVRNGQPEQALAAYRRADEAPGSDLWPYREVLRQRLAAVAQDQFVAGATAPMMSSSAYACAACHATGQTADR